MLFCQKIFLHTSACILNLSLKKFSKKNIFFFAKKKVFYLSGTKKNTSHVFRIMKGAIISQDVYWKWFTFTLNLKTRLYEEKFFDKKSIKKTPKFSRMQALVWRKIFWQKSIKKTPKFSTMYSTLYLSFK